jgi:hypothetical protein
MSAFMLIADLLRLPTSSAKTFFLSRYTPCRRLGGEEV